ncbi:MAG: tRNA pseudouridine(55) synthase TruB [Magnetovibrio sp.]|nr:tRNA pseudouridine(55) synthase TruB [Magnetovibrio sp.]
MARKRKGLPIHGWLNIDKPINLSSAGVVGRVRRATGAAKVGHAGTLDPLATGVLPIALGEATKTVPFAVNSKKTYRFSLKFGSATNTNDQEGEITETSDIRPKRAEIIEILPLFRGSIYQVPPVYSAIKVNGRRAYELARRSEEVKLVPRKVDIHSLTLMKIVDIDHVIFEVVSGKGAYMRSLARDIARALNTVGHIAWLRRIAVGTFHTRNAISLDNLEMLGHSAAALNVLLPVETVLDDIPALALTKQEANKLRRGQSVAFLPVAQRSVCQDIRQGDTVRTMNDGKLTALAKIAGGEIRPVRVINL